MLKQNIKLIGCIIRNGSLSKRVGENNEKEKKWLLLPFTI
jgi:hypothetical protein